ncbi:MAG: hypothetical protein KG075_12535 [Alphaproteobacteria bacterium]|nr:hypothetical protein [Alphaproteobacteria bacterium]
MSRIARTDWPVSDIDKLDQDLGKQVSQLSTGRASANSASEATRIIRERASHMMPPVFAKIRRDRSK